jgi:hypothetical protein
MVIAEMSFPSRSAKLSLLILGLLALSAGPALWSSHSLPFWLGAKAAFANSPDETLNPPPNPPPGKSRSAALPGMASTHWDAASVASTRPTATLGRFERLLLVWRHYLAPVFRI